MSRDGSSAGKVIGIILLILGLAGLAAGIVYFTVPAKSLPSFMGHIANATAHRTKRGLAGVVGGAILLVGSIIAFWSARRS